ncbi:hypothetical protein L596_009217 [Steinernema carpocapsae]|uniref:LITAF domain-containing protein n=1 Tax=Steinernema carpocapsae TaxID=34508 RepID=A0A4U5PER4_STECR|nr:hypothetical protein L596_009217 [Steinernema carpocapsae]
MLMFLPMIFSGGAMKGAKRCPDCKLGQMEKHYTPFGLLMCISLCYYCMLGVCIAQYTRVKHCNDCWAKRQIAKGPELRANVLFVRDRDADLEKPVEYMQDKDFSDRIELKGAMGMAAGL